MKNMPKRKIGYKQVLNQLGKDLIGKDSYRGVTFTYSWLANQFGHYSLGYMPTLIAWAIIKEFKKWETPAFWAALIISTLWFFFELYNFLGPLLLNKQSTAQNLFVPSKTKYTFQPDWRNVAFDTFTDLLFFWFGAFSASIFLNFSWTVLIILIVLFLAFLYPAYYWYVTKMYLQYAKLPIQFRLSQWKRQPKEPPLSSVDVKTVLLYLNNVNKSSGNHLLIFGGRRSGKTKLSIGMGTELSIKKYTSSYYTAMKLFNSFSLNESEIMTADDCEVWSWRSASLLIIDDINPGNPIPKIFLSAQDVLDAINTGDSSENRECLKNKNVIWVLGDDDSMNAGSWQKMLLDIGLDEDKIKTIGLGFIIM
jgi:hypothetical protein